MLSAISAAAAVLIAMFWYLFSLGTNGHMRAQAEKHPDSWMYLYVSVFDQFLKATFLRSIHPEPADLKIAGESLPDSALERDLPHEAPAFMTARYAIQVLINPRVKVPNRVWLLWTPQAQLAFFLGFATLLYGLVSVALLHFVSVGALLFAYMVLLSVLMTTLFAMMILEKGVFRVVMKLHMNPFIVLFMTNRTVFLHSSWLPRREVPNQGIRFIASDGQFMSEISVILSDHAAPIVVFSYPTFFRQYLMNEGELSALAGKLNKLVAMARNAPQLDLDKPLFKLA